MEWLLHPCHFTCVLLRLALRVFTKGNRDGYSTPDIVTTFALLGGACALEVASVLKMIWSTWTYAILRNYDWDRLAIVILFARYHLVAIKDGRWSDSIGQINLISFCVHRGKKDLKGRIARLIGLRDWWDKARCTKHPKLSPEVKEFVWGLLKGDKRHMVQIEDVTIQSGYWARRFTGFAESQQLNWSLSIEFHKSMLIWHIATSTFLNHPDVKSELVGKYKGMAGAVETLSDYMMYLLVEHPDMLPIKPAAHSLFGETSGSYMQLLSIWNKSNADGNYQMILNYKKVFSDPRKDRSMGVVNQDDLVLWQACSLVHTMLNMKLELIHKMVIIGTVWVEMLCYAATNATGGFHARQLSNGGEFLTHILLLIKHADAVSKSVGGIVEATVGDDELTAGGNSPSVHSDGCNDEITEAC
ncbi:uncharacterized protein LOC119331999 [Triticum dicoccoides]|uniref:uncharacterized protein LOC119331999 n=1 Tax=Triticum dicoccoides TaxID=85692 RepID=UPI000E7BDF01|nr:uncharacterized protein LOC119331999 [Triticum dicoccoides]